MAQIIPSITSLPSDSGAAPSVEDIQDHLPSICVDYLSHNWTEEDVWASWRNMTRHKHEIANGVRLENASWRTWQKQRNKLRTISPETLNWLKDSDVTWLYGPLHTANVQSVPPAKVPSAHDRLGIDNHTSKPGILKHRTLSELLSIPGQSSPTLEEACCEENNGGPSDYITATGKSKGNKKPQLLKTKSDSLLSRSNSLPARRRPAPPDLSVANDENLKSKKEHSPESAKDSGKRHITFNTFVEQCIALDDPIVNREDSDEEDVLEMKSSLSRYSSRSSSIHSSTSQTIQKIPPTMLKTLGSYTNNPSLPRMVYMPPLEYRSPGVEEPPITSPMGIPSPRVAMAARQWNNNPAATQLDEDFHTGDDYFGGPDLTGPSTSPTVTVTGPSPASTTGGGFGRGPVVQQPPAQPKWRAGQDAVGTSSGSSSTSSLNGMGSSPSPGRGILKVRSPQPPVDSGSPDQLSPPVAFNYNPSVATGFGGLYGSYDGSPAAIPFNGQSNDREERGRSTSRGHGSSQYDRSTTSRNSSSSSLGSVSRSPNDSTATPVSIPKPVRPANSTIDKVEEGTEWRPAQAASSTHEPMDVDYSPERSSTPTPHSSPQIVLRPLKDTSPASLPHTTSAQDAVVPSAASQLPNHSSALPTTVQDLDAEMQIDSASTVPMSSPTGRQSPATVASVSANAEGTMSQPVDDEDGSTLIGRATNIANTAKDLLGALWYGAHDEQGRTSRDQPTDGRRRNHRRWGSMG